ncbi:MAG TPA: outer membrane protein assembly factor BamA, partial [Candidatus Binatia bacterium]|nr:outer membrane protein assembly factor BamA [Candidatus Binatia bacterium]
MRPLSQTVIALLLGFMLFPERAFAVLTDALDTTREWKVQGIEFFGNQAFSADELSEAMSTKARAWYRVWEDRPPFDPITFQNDLEKLQRFYESKGYYGTTVAYDLEVDESKSAITARISIDEAPPVLISAVDIEVSGDRSALAALPKELPVKQGAVFREAEYQQGEQILRTFFLEHGYAHVKTERKAVVNVDERRVNIQYSVEPGPIAVFGATEVKGTDTVDPEIIKRELTYRSGETYSQSKVSESRDKILALDLFGSVRIAPAETQGTPAVVPMEIEVTEKSHREIRLGVGWGTEDRFRTLLEWRHFNWLGDGRRLSIVGRYSSIAIRGAIDLVQPHFLTPRTRGALNLSYDQEDEETYLRHVGRFAPRLEQQFSRALTGFVLYRFEYDKLNEIDSATVDALGPIRRKGFLSGPSAGMVWNTTDDPLNPKRGEVVTFGFDYGGWGGDFNFYKMTAEGKKYIDIGWQTIFASRLKLGLADSIGASENLPIFERFYSGGEKSVRGYVRRHLGPLSSIGDPLGGLSLVEGSLELRRPIWKELSGAVFVDFGQVSKRSFDLPFGNLQFSRGFGVNYTTPVGPLSLYVGFPVHPPRGD